MRELIVDHIFSLQELSGAIDNSLNGKVIRYFCDQGELWIHDEATIYNYGCDIENYKCLKKRVIPELLFSILEFLVIRPKSVPRLSSMEYFQFKNIAAICKIV